jgi:hypothetical protein
MKVIRAVCQVNLGVAKELVSNHPAWATVVEANKSFHQMLGKLAEAIAETGDWEIVEQVEPETEKQEEKENTCRKIL